MYCASNVFARRASRSSPNLCNPQPRNLEAAELQIAEHHEAAESVQRTVEVLGSHDGDRHWGVENSWLSLQHGSTCVQAASC